MPEAIFRKDTMVRTALLFHMYMVWTVFYKNAQKLYSIRMGKAPGAGQFTNRVFLSLKKRPAPH